MSKLNYLSLTSYHLDRVVVKTTIIILNDNHYIIIINDEVVHHFGLKTFGAIT